MRVRKPLLSILCVVAGFHVWHQVASAANTLIAASDFAPYRSTDGGAVPTDDGSRFLIENTSSVLQSAAVILSGEPGRLPKKLFSDAAAIRPGE